MEPRILQKGGRKYVYEALYLNISLFLYNQFRYLLNIIGIRKFCFYL